MGTAWLKSMTLHGKMIYTVRERTVYGGEHHTPLGAAFQGRFLDKHEGANSVTYRTIRLRKALGEMFATPTFSAHRHYPNCSGDIDHGKSAKGV